MNTSKKIALIGAVALAIVYEAILFTTVIKGGYSQSLSFFFAYLFSLAAAAPIAIIFIIFARASGKRVVLRQ